MCSLGGATHVGPAVRVPEAVGGDFVAPLWHRDVEFGAVLVDRGLQQVRLAVQCDAHLVKMPRATPLAARRFKPVGKVLAEFFALVSDRLVPTGLPSGRRSKPRRAPVATPHIAQAQLKAENTSAQRN